MSWNGTFEIFQYQPFAEVYARHTRRRCVKIGEDWGYLSSVGGLGATTLGIYNCPGSGPEALTRLRDAALQHKVARLWANLLECPSGPACGRVERLDTLTIDLTPSEPVLWKQIGSNTRWKIRRCLKDAVTIKVADTTDFEAWWTLYCKIAYKKAFSRQPRALVEDLVHRTDLTTLLVAKCSSGRVIGGMFFLNHQYPVYWLGAFERGGPVNTGQLTLWESLLHFKQRGFTILDLGGVERDPKHGPSEFKRAFHGEPRSTYACTVVLDPIRNGVLKAGAWIRAVLS